VNLPLQITFRDIPPSDAIEAKIRDRVAKLGKLHDRVTRCNVVVESLQRRRFTGTLYNVRVELSVPGREPLVVNRTPTERTSHEDAYVAVRDAFDAAERRLDQLGHRMRGDVKRHETPPHGWVLRVDPLEGHGFFETPDGLEVYFHENALLTGKLSDLGVGSEVRFTLAEGEGMKGPQASSVQPVGKHHVL
jgi:cold shock CspA family protein/ribosome-associated translation inhibitor RaiA